MTTDENIKILQAAKEKGIIYAIPDSPDLQQKLIIQLDKSNKLTALRKDAKKITLDEDEEYYKVLLEKGIESGLPIPHEIEGDPPKLPLDLTSVSDKEVRFLHGAFNACAARAGWLYACEETGEAAAKQIADHLEDEYITGLGEERKDFGGKPKTQALLKAEAQRANPDIVKWRKRERQHSIAGNKYKRILDAYDGNCERLSREWTMRVNEREHV